MLGSIGLGMKGYAFVHSLWDDNTPGLCLDDGSNGLLAYDFRD